MSRTPRRECLDWLLITSERHLRHGLHEYAAHYNAARPHRALTLRPPLGSPVHQVGDGSGHGAVRRRDRLGGLLHEYERAAA